MVNGGDWTMDPNSKGSLNDACTVCFMSREREREREGKRKVLFRLTKKKKEKRKVG